MTACQIVMFSLPRVPADVYDSTPAPSFPSLACPAEHGAPAGAPRAAPYPAPLRRSGARQGISALPQNIDGHVNHFGEGVNPPMTQAAAPQTVRKRSEIPEKYRWRLEDIYATDEAWEADFRAVQSVLPRFESYKGRLGESPATLAECLNLRFETEERFMRLLVYAYTRRDEDSTNPKYQAIHDRAQRLGIQLSTAVSFIEPELLQLPQERLEQYMAAEELKLYRHYLDDLLRHKPHTLSPQEEAILAAAGELALAPSNVFGMFNDADLKFPFIKDEQGREVEVTHGRYLRLMESRDRRVRHDAFKALHGTYYKWRNTIAATYAASVRK